MTVDTIIRIRSLRDEVRQKIKETDKKANTDRKYGGENEYTFKGIVGGLDALMTDISTLTSYPSKFIRISTHAERNSIVNSLNHINNGFSNPVGFMSYFENLKVLLRNLNVRSFSERQIEFENEVAETKKIKLELEQELSEVNKIRADINENKINIEEREISVNNKFQEIEGELSTIVEKKDNLIKQSDTLEEVIEGISSLKDSAEDKLDEIKASTSESKANEKLIVSFSKKVYESEKQVELLEEKSSESIDKLRDYEEERKGILQEAQKLIDSAKQALNYKTAESISAAFQGQYNISNSKVIFISWITGAVLFLITTIVLGVWIAFFSTDSLTPILVARISLLPLPILGTIFCASQYTKQKNIKEDYAYKMVLSKAIVGFSEQLKKHSSENNEEYVHYIKTALKEIHKDPLRKRNKKSQKENNSKPNFNDVIDLAEKIAKISKD